MSLDALTTFVSEAILTYVLLLNSIKIGGISLIGVFILYALLGMVLVIVFRVETNSLFDFVQARFLPSRYQGASARLSSRSYRTSTSRLKKNTSRGKKK